MTLSVKTLIGLFVAGVLAGVAASPFRSAAPKDFIASPVTAIDAKEDNQTLTENPGTKPSTIRAYFALYDWEQDMLKKEKTQVLGASTEERSASQAVSTSTGVFSVAIIGDSMVDTMESGLPYLDKALKPYAPNLSFRFLNYGIGSEPVSSAVARLDSAHTYKDRSYPPIMQCGADVYIIDSFAYNPGGESESDLNAYSDNLSTLITSLQSTGKPVLFVATIAPLKSKFGQGPGGVNWEPDTAWKHATTIQTYMERGLKTAKTHNVPVVDIYHQTLRDNGEGVPAYVNTHDGIHPSVAGHRFIAQHLAQALVNYHLLP